MVEVGERVSLIQQIGLFQSVDPAELETIAHQMAENTFEDGEIVFLEGDTGNRAHQPTEPSAFECSYAGLLLVHLYDFKAP